VTDAVNKPKVELLNGFRPSQVADVVGREMVGAAVEDRKPTGGSAQVFEAALSEAAGTFASRLPTGAAAAAWARWRPPAEALGMVPPSASIVAGNAGGPLTSSDLTRALTVSGPGTTGAVFTVADTPGEAVTNVAGEHLGRSFVADGSDPSVGFDGPGLVQYAYGELGIRLPRSSADQATMGVAVPSLEQARPGDLLAFGQPVDHVGIYAGDGNMLHVAGPAGRVTVEAVPSGSGAEPIAAIRRILSGNATGPAVLRAAGTQGPSGLGPLPSEVTPESGPDAAMAPAAGAAYDGPIDGVPHAELFSAAGAQWNVDAELLAAVAQVESAFDPTAVSPAGAQGLMQFMPATAREMEVDPWDPASAIDGAARYLRTSLGQFNEVDLALASYNAGRGAVRRYGGVPPFPETEDYVRKVLDVWRNPS
jgi:cell wall-associated NlpC family hydrolase